MCIPISLCSKLRTNHRSDASEQQSVRWGYEIRQELTAYTQGGHDWDQRSMVLDEEPNLALIFRVGGCGQGGCGQGGCGQFHFLAVFNTGAFAVHYGPA